MSPVPVKITLPEKHHVYKVRECKYLGRTAVIEVDMPIGNGLLFALMPYEIRGVHVDRVREEVN